MKFELSSEQIMMRDATRRMSERDIRPILEANDPDRSLPRGAMVEIYALLASHGLMAPRVPEADGGGGLSMLDYGIMFEQLPPHIAMSLMGHEVTITRLHSESTPEQRERFLPDLFAGRKFCGTGTTEPDVGSNPREVKTRVREEGEELVIDGRKSWITNASIADIANVTCVGSEGEAKGRLRRVVVEREHSAFEAREIPVLGLNQGHLGEWVFEACRVPTANALGEAGDAARLLTLTWNVNRPLVGLAAVGLAQRAFEAAVDYAGVRHQFGKPIGGHQLIQKNLADIETAVTTSRLLCYMALDTVDRGERANGVSAMAKRHATTACEEAVSLAMHSHGAMGIGQETGLERLWRDVRMLAVPDATNEILTLIQGREITGQAAFR